MNKLISYVIAILGLIVIVLSFNLSVGELIKGIGLKVTYLMILGIVLVILGVVLSLNKKQAGQEAEVPIYEGEGKKRKIVGYRRHK